MRRQADILPPLPEAQAKATATSPDLQSARLSVQQAGYEHDIARYGYLPSLGLDFFYGIDANQFAAQSALANESGRSTLPDYQVANRQNLGYSAQATLNIPVWNWGATRSKVKQAELKQQQAELDLTLAQRTLQGNLATAYRGGAGRAGAAGFVAQFVRSLGGKSAAHAASLSGGRSECARSGGRADYAGAGAQRVR